MTTRATLRQRNAGKSGQAGCDPTLAKRLFIKTYGCQMNVYDSARMADVLAPLGYAPADEPDDADLVILNTCHIREKATEKVYSELGRLRPLQARAARRGRRHDHRGSRLRRAGRGRGDHSVARRGRYRRRPAGLSPAAGTGRARRARCRSRAPRHLDTTSRSSTKFDHLPEAAQARPACRRSCRCRKVATSSAPSASCPIRAAPSSRGRFPTSNARRVDWSRAARARSRCSART